MNFGQINAIVMKSIGVDTVIRDGVKYEVDRIAEDIQFASMFCYVANCLSNIMSQAYIVPYDVFKITEQVSGHDVDLVERNGLDIFPINLGATPAMYVPISCYIVEKMGVRVGNEINFDNLTQLFRELIETVEPGQVMSTNPFSLMLISLTCPEFMRGMLPVFAPSLFPAPQTIENEFIEEHVFVDDSFGNSNDNPFLSGADGTYDNSEALGL